MASTPTTETNRIERLLAALEGVVSARVVADNNGRVLEIHILSSHELHPKQMVRNVESALSAGLGLVVDRRVISVAQLRPDVGPITSGPVPVPEAEAGARTRQLFVGFDTTCSAPLDAQCTVTLRSDNQNLVGTGSGANTTQGRAEAAARALFDALGVYNEQTRLAFEGATLVEANGKTYVLVAAHALTGRSTRRLTGIAAVGRSPEEAAILAGLQATNRISSIP
ncbi:MAG: hypothetical protein ACREMA_04685 [Longimicrobiales bacterium]